MIHTSRIVTVGEQECIIDRPIVLYRGDREVEIEFTLVGNEFMFSEEGNVIKSVNASHGQLVLNTPSGEHMFSELAECHEGKVVFVVTKEMIDEFIEMGFYSFQIRLYDSAEMKSRVTIPPVMNGFDIRNPIAAEDETNVVDQGIVDYARIFKDQSNEELPTFDWTGAYNKTEWVHHDVITENKMNKIEDALYSINANIKESDVVMLNALDNVKKDADKYVKEHMAEVEAEVDEFERNLNTDVQQFKIDTNAAMTAHKNEVSEELEHKPNKSDLFIDVKDYGAKGDGVTDDTQSIKNAISDLINGMTLYFPRGTYIVSETLQPTVGNITIKGQYSNISAPRDLDIVIWKFYNLVNVNIDGLVSTNSVNAQTWIKAISTHHLHVTNCATDGMKLGFDLSDCYWTKIESVRMQSVYQAFQFKSATNAFQLANVSIHGAGIPSTIYETTTGGNITGCSFEASSGRININKSFGINIDGNYFEGYGTPEDYIYIGSANYKFTCGINIAGNLFYAGAKNAITLSHVEGIAIHGNSMTTDNGVRLYAYDTSKQYNISYLGNYYGGKGKEFNIYGSTNNASISPEYSFPLVFKKQKIDCKPLAAGEIALRNYGGRLGVKVPTGVDVPMIKRKIFSGTIAANEVKNLDDILNPNNNMNGFIFIYGADNTGNSAMYAWFNNENNTYQQFRAAQIYNTIGITVDYSSAVNNRIVVTNTNSSSKWIVIYLYM